MNKFLFLIAFVSLSFFGFSDFDEQNQFLNSEAIELACKYRQCNATAESTGNRCKHCVSRNDHYQCWQHI